MIKNSWHLVFFETNPPTEASPLRGILPIANLAPVPLVRLILFGGRNLKWGKEYVRISAGEGCSKMMDSFTIFGDIFEETMFLGHGIFHVFL